jgi:hypothetical protein
MSLIIERIPEFCKSESTTTKLVLTMKEFSMFYKFNSKGRQLRFDHPMFLSSKVKG